MWLSNLQYQYNEQKIKKYCLIKTLKALSLNQLADHQEDSIKLGLSFSYYTNYQLLQQQLILYYYFNLDLMGNSIQFQQLIKLNLHSLQDIEIFFVQLTNHEKNCKTIIYHFATILQIMSLSFCIIISWNNFPINKQFNECHNKCNYNYE
ncbi:unnamed protein product [Paramecium sonneborni]|uniref:Transmembrane protein n=1 Tax=Paramecium sonneborni TaxID=65129 RepID=A0A8S1R753_9CILI|nr:unnamed protein product [Paramecium sonneborni]